MATTTISRLKLLTFYFVYTEFFFSMRLKESLLNVSRYWVTHRVGRIHEAVVDHGDEALVDCPTVAPRRLQEIPLPQEGERHQGVTEENGQAEEGHHQQRFTWK